jgi:hypothetical protein
MSTPIRKAYPVTKLLPVENIILGNGKVPRFSSEDQHAALMAVLRKQIAEQDGNTIYVMCCNLTEHAFLRRFREGSERMPRHVYLCHPDLAFEIMQNVIANPDIQGDPTKPRKYIKLYIDLPEYTDLCLLPDGKSHSLQFSHRLLNLAAHYADTISATVDMNIRG